MISNFTRIIRSRGWTVTEACEYWGLQYDTYNRRCNNPRMKAQLICMCRGLENKLDKECEYNGVVKGVNSKRKILNYIEAREVEE